MSLGLPTSINTSENYDDKLLSFFGRVSYNFDEKYLLTATLRADGSSKFGKNNKWGWFPSVSAAWRLIEEDFIRELGVFSDLKLRAGYGSAGNNRINSYLNAELCDSKKGSELLQGIVDSGKLGVKSGAGFYDYSGDKANEAIRERDRMYIELAKVLYFNK